MWIKSGIARDVGISQTTVGQWLSALEAGNQVTILEPFFARPRGGRPGRAYGGDTTAGRQPHRGVRFPGRRFFACRRLTTAELTQRALRGTVLLRLEAA